MIKAVLMGIEALGEVGIASGAIMQKIGADLKNVAVEISIVIIGYLMRLILIDHKKIVIVHVIKLTADQKAFAARKTEKDLTAIVNMYIRVRISLLGIVDPEACVVAGIGNCQGAAFEYAFHGFFLSPSSLTAIFYIVFVIISYDGENCNIFIENCLFFCKKIC